MFNVGNEVRLSDDIHYYDSRNELVSAKHLCGVITNAQHNIASTFSSKYTIHINNSNDVIYDVYDHQIKLITPQPLTLVEIQQRKEQLARDLFTLIETYEKTTNTHISTLTLSMFRAKNELGVWTDRVTGVRLEVQL